MSQFHGQWRRRPSSSGFPHSPVLETIDDASESSFAVHGQTRSSSLGFGIFSERRLDLYIEGETLTPNPSSEIVALHGEPFTPVPSNEIVALPPANRQIVRNNNYITLPQVLEHRRLDWLLHSESLLPMLEQDNADPEIADEPWGPSTSTFLQPHKRQGERSEDARPSIIHAQSCGNIPKESGAQESAESWKRLSGLLRTRRAKSEAVVLTQARNVKMESQRKKEGRGRWRRVKAFFLRK